MALKYKTVKKSAYVNTFDKSISMIIYYIPNSIPLPNVASANILKKLPLDN